ncbi:Golgi apparatus membrane protein TVP38 [Hondaea fermentalgiana]|uniref:Golgi apparatus membrane protein TVP38 n=1 Tax=Hondaea fermentalgiana TaxID=2315210 RepID=A0A2R5H097_9STRA|nr:Golgi apparatus membrane protein TVP38 [Hondaea fermentalgiana]|eukprot:GBG33734.1 Golgi apparatus membrane protein TVP38 [Hondaea fermentalgiana]
MAGTRSACSGLVSVECARRRWKQLLVVALLVAVIVAAVVDALTCSCMMTETEQDRVQRLYCEGLLNATSDGTVEPGQSFRCSRTDSDEEAWVPSGEEPNTCIQSSSCLAVGFQAVLEWISEHPGEGWAVTALVYAVLTMALIPGSVLTIGSGVAFGTALGLGKGTAVAATAVIVGASVGATMAFLMGRYLLREVINQWAKKFRVIKALDKALETQGFRITLLLRLSPIVPFNVFNFIMGSTSCELRDYVLATSLGIIPGTFAFVFIGALVGSAAFEGTSMANLSDNGSQVYPDLCEESAQAKTIRIVIIVVGIVATILAVVLLTIVGRRQFRKLAEADGVDLDDLDESTSRAQVSNEDGEAA